MPRRNKSSLVVWVALPLVVLLAIAGFVAIGAVLSENQARVTQQMADEAKLANVSVEGFLGRYLSILEQAEANPIFERYLNAQKTSEQVVDNPYLPELRFIINKVQTASGGRFLSTWVYDVPTSTLVRSHNVADADGGGVVCNRPPWFRTASVNKHSFFTVPYKGSSTGQHVVSLICPLVDKTSGEVTGIFGADLDVEVLAPVMEGVCPKGDAHLALIAQDNTVLYHPDKNFLYQQIDGLPYSANIIEGLHKREAGTHSYTRNGVAMQGTISIPENGDWLVLSELSQYKINELMSSTIGLLAGCFLLALALLAASMVILKKLLSGQEENELVLEDEVKKRTQSLLKQDAMLWTVNDISKKLLSTNTEQAFDAVIKDCLRMIGENTGGNRVYIWKDVTNSQGELCCIQVYEWVRGAAPIQDIELFENVPYSALPTFRKKLDQKICLNSHVRDLSPSERAVLEPQGIATLLIAPIIIEDTRWGFIGVDNCESTALFSEVEEKIILISGFLMASAILRQATETQLRETEELVQAMFDATPLCCSVWNSRDELLTCNEGALRLFGVDNKTNFLEHFKSLSPEVQPCGGSSAELSAEHIREAFSTGYRAFEWMHQNAQGEPLPTDVTLVRIRYKNEDALAAYVRDLRELKAQEAQRQEAEERTLVMLNAMPLCCNFWNKNYENLACNDAAPHLFGLQSQQEYLERFNELSPPVQPGGIPSADLALEKITQAFTEGYSRFEWLHQMLDGTPIPSEITLVRVLFKNEYIVAGYTRDLRELKAMLEEVRTVEQELALARDEAVANSTAKSEFLARMSHEIRTPMNAIVGMSELILRAGLPPKVQEHALDIKQAGAHLLSIINDILDFSKIESGKLEIVTGDYLLASLLNDTINIIRVRMLEKPLMFTVNIDPDLPNHLVGDDIRLRQILLNVLSNAVKYTEEGFISLSISGEKLDEDTVRLRIVVADSGIGIREDDLESLFGRFVQFDSAKHKGVEGSGLGLAITRSLCRAMGGDITAESEYQKGSSFTVEVLQGYKGEEWIAAVEHPQEVTVLLYEPRARIADSIVSTLDKLSVKYARVQNRSDFYEHISNPSYTFILMPNVVFETTKELLEQANILHNVVVFKDHGESVALSEVKTVSTPLYAINLANVLNGVGELLDADSFDALIRFTAPSARVLVVDDISTNLKVAEGLMSPYGMTIELCESGEEAVEKVRTTNYDVVFMDHMMPGMNGIEATLAIRALPDCQDVPIVALTANAVVGVKELFLANGFNDFLAKPIETSKLNAILDRWIPRYKQEKITVSSARPEPQAAVFAIEGVNVEQGLAMTGGSVEHYLNILSTYHSDGRARLPELRSTLEKDDLGLYATYVHALKSASASIGAATLSEMARQLEMAAKESDRDFLLKHTEPFLTDFEAVLDNIGYIMSSQEHAAPKESMTDSELRETLLQLKDALDSMDGIAADAFIGRLRNHKKSVSMKESVELIANHVLLCDYDDAIEVIDSLIAGQ